jgi:Flp pilus assembly protein TadG
VAFETKLMRLPSRSPWSPLQLRIKFARGLRDDRGATAVEFAIVALPFFLFVLGILFFGLYFFTTNALEHGAESAARQVRTGQAQKSNITVGEFKQLVCDKSGSYITCDKLHVLVQHAPTWAGIQPESCVDSSNSMAPSTGDSGDILYDYTGGASQVVLITLCYEWDLARSFGILGMGSGDDGSGPAIMQAATAFRTEPYSS